MKYKTGMYGGSFDPLHTGHIHDIIRAAGMCEELYVMISWCEGRESVSKELRYRWIYNSCKHLANMKIIMIEDEAADKEAYNTDYYWEKGAEDIKKAIGRKIDAVFCGSDYFGTNRFESLYSPESEVIYFDREEVPVCSTDIRRWALEHWDYLPEACKPYYAKKVLAVGGESTGKSTLVQNLALAYNTNYVAEVGRDVTEKAGCEELMVMEDFLEILLRHKIKEMDAIRKSNRVLFIDTDAVTTKFYAHFLLSRPEEIQKCDALADAVAGINSFDLILFLEPTVAFVQDGTRSETIAAGRERYSNQLKQLLEESGMRFECLSGDYVERFNRAKELIREYFGLDTVW